jgi:pantothenate kinase
VNFGIKVEAQLRERLTGVERVYYAGSFGKGTTIRESYGLDLVIYWSQKAQFTLKNIYAGVGNALKKHWTYVNF